MKKQIYTAVVEHMSGMDHYAAITEEGLYLQLADYCHSRWETCDKPDVTFVEGDTRKYVEHYFENHENDSLTLGICNVPGLGPPSREEFLEAAHQKNFVQCLEEAFTEAGLDVCRWQELKDITVGDLAKAAAARGIVFRCLPVSELSEFNRRAEAAWDLLDDAYTMIT